MLTASVWARICSDLLKGESVSITQFTVFLPVYVYVGEKHHSKGDDMVLHFCMGVV